jgi:hypothetical protein
MKTQRRSTVADVCQIFTLLLLLKAKPGRGFRQCAYAVYLAIQDPDRTMFSTKWLYPEVARHYKTDWMEVELNIQSVVDSVWENSAHLLRQITGNMLKAQPAPEQFILLLAVHFLCFPRAA